MSQPILIGLGHRARHGKDTIARLIVEEFGGQYKIATLPFAAALKKEVNQAASETASGTMLELFEMLANKEFIGVPPLPEWVQYEENPDMTDPLSPLGKQRTLLMWWGTEFRRHTTDRNYWVKRHREEVSRLAAQGYQFVLVPDMRFPNEFMYVESMDGRTVKVERTNFDNGLGDHESETGLAGPNWQWFATVQSDEIPDPVERDREMRRDARALFEMILDDYNVSLKKHSLISTRVAESLLA